MPGVEGIVMNLIKVKDLRWTQALESMAG